MQILTYINQCTACRMSQILVFILVQLNWTKKKGTVTFVYKVDKRIRLFDAAHKAIINFIENM